MPGCGAGPAQLYLKALGNVQGATTGDHRATAPTLQISRSYGLAGGMPGVGRTVSGENAVAYLGPRF